MKWIATHIWDFISRFRNDVYLESLDISSETGVLVVDSDGKVTKNTGISGGAASSLSDGSTSTGDTFTFTSANTTDPLFIIKNTTNDANGAKLRFVKDKGAAGAINDNLGNIEFYGDDALQQQTLFAKIHSKIVTATNGQEGGRLSLGVASHDGVFRDAISIVDDGVAEPSIMLEASTGGKIVSRTSETLITWGEDGLTGLFANADLDIGDQDFRAQTFTSDVATGTAPFTVSSTTQVANLNAATAGTAGALSSGTSTGDTFTFTSANANDPLFVIQNTTNDDSAPRLKLFNNKGADGADDDYGGTILFSGFNDAGTPAEINFGAIYCQADQLTTSVGSEKAKFSFNLLNGSGSVAEILDLNSTTSYLRSNLNVNGTLAIADIDVTSTAGQSLTITAGVYDNPVKIVGGDSKVFTAYSDNSTAGTNTIGVGALGDDSYFRNDEGSFKFYVADDTTVAAELTQAGNLTITGVLTCTSSDASVPALTLNQTSATGNPFLAFSQNGTRRSFIQHHDTDNKFRFASEFGALSLEAASSAGTDSNTAYLVIDPGGTFTLGAENSDVVLTTDGNMTFRIDADNDETSQKFAFQNNASTEIANLNESGDLQIDGDLTVGGNIINSGASAIFKSIDTTQNYVVEVGGFDNGPKVNFGDTDSSTDAFMTMGAFSAINQIDTAARDFHLYGTNTTTGFYFDESEGKFGIGTDAPSEKLSVNGNMTVSGDLTVSGNDIKDSGGSAAITFDGSANVTIPTANLTCTNHATVSKTLTVGGSIASAPAVVYRTAKVTLNTLACNNLHTTPHTLVSGGGANTVIVPVSGMVRVDRAATQANSGPDLNFHYESQEPGTYGDSVLFHIRRFMYNETGDRVYIIDPLSAFQSSQNLTDDVDKDLEVSVDSQLTPNCFTSVTIFLTYHIFDIS